MSQPAEASSPGDGGLGPRGAWAGRTLGHESWKSAQSPTWAPWEFGGIITVPRAAKCRQSTGENLAGRSLRVPKAS